MLAQARKYAKLATTFASHYDETQAEAYAEKALAAYGMVGSERELREDLGRYVAEYYADSFHS